MPSALGRVHAVKHLIAMDERIKTMHYEDLLVHPAVMILARVYHLKVDTIVSLIYTELDYRKNNPDAAIPKL